MRSIVRISGISFDNSYIWEDYEKQQEKLHKGIFHTKNFKYPPILPIVYYEDAPEWTAGGLKSRIALNDAFSEYIPDFQYHLVSLNKYDNQVLIDKKDELSFLMLINKIRNAEEFKNLNLPDGYIKKLLLNSPADVIDVISKVIMVVLRKHNVPENEIQDVVDQVKERKSMALFDNYKGFDVQAERKYGQKELLIKLICENLQDGNSVEDIARFLRTSADQVTEVADIIGELGDGYCVDDVIKHMKDKKVQPV